MSNNDDDDARQPAQRQANMDALELGVKVMNGRVEVDEAADVEHDVEVLGEETGKEVIDVDGDDTDEQEDAASEFDDACRAVNQLTGITKGRKAEWLVLVQCVEAAAAAWGASDVLRRRIAAVRKEIVQPKDAVAKRKQISVIAAFKKRPRGGGGGAKE